MYMMHNAFHYHSVAIGCCAPPQEKDLSYPYLGLPFLSSLSIKRAQRPCLSNMATSRVEAAMALKIKTFLLALLLLFLPFTSGFVEGFRENMHPSAGHLLYKAGMKMKSRKLFEHAYTLDYGDGGASGKHRRPGRTP